MKFKKLKTKPLFLFAALFMLFTIIGTLSHEYGHILVAKSFGFETSLHYASMNYYPSDSNDVGTADYARKSLWVGMGGPLQTILTAIIGLVILISRRNLIEKRGLKALDWLAVFLALFFLREVFNPLISVASEIYSPDGSYFGGDERKLSLGFNLWEGSISILLGIVGFFASCFVVFRIVPKALRYTFIAAGLLGGSAGYIFWMMILGPLLLP